MDINISNLKSTNGRMGVSTNETLIGMHTLFLRPTWLERQS